MVTITPTKSSDIIVRIRNWISDCVIIPLRLPYFSARNALMLNTKKSIQPDTNMDKRNVDAKKEPTIRLAKIMLAQFTNRDFAVLL